MSKKILNRYIIHYSFQSEDLNTLIGNAFRVAYAVQIQSDMDEQQKFSQLKQNARDYPEKFPNDNVLQDPTPKGCILPSSKIQSEINSISPNYTNNNNHLSNCNRKGAFTQSRSVESLLSSNINQCGNSSSSMQNDFYSDDDANDNVDDGTYANVDEISHIKNTSGNPDSRASITNNNGKGINSTSEEPFYETADFVRAARERRSDNTFSRKSTTQFFQCVSCVQN